jgi:hypothetical protein
LILCAQLDRFGGPQIDTTRDGLFATCENLTGIAVHIGARVAAAAQPGEVLVSRTVADLVTGSGVPFRDRGVHRLKGVPGSWQLWGGQVIDAGRDRPTPGPRDQGHLSRGEERSHDH